MPNNPNAQNPFPGPAGPDGYQRISGTCSDYDMVRLRTGNLIRIVSVARVPTVGLPLELYLVYNLQDTALGPVGHGWRHNLMMRLVLTGSPVNYVTFESEAGRHFDFVPDGGGGWKLHTNSYFLSGKLTRAAGSPWRITFPNGTFYEFDETTGALLRMVDRHGNANTLTVGTNMLTVTEPTGRALVLTFNATTGLLETVSDPMSNLTRLYYDGSQNLTRVVFEDELGEDGCVLQYGYANPSDHRLTSRTDLKGFTYGYTYLADPATGAPMLNTVTDAELPANTITYTYQTVDEHTGGPADPPQDPTMTQEPFPQTTLVDARGKTWRYRFDVSGNLWRSIDPLGHQVHYYWNSEQKLLYETGGFPLSATEPFGPRDNLNNAYRRAMFDAEGNALYRADASGLVTAFTYDQNRRVTSVYPGRAHLGVQGNWTKEFGSEGYVLCAFDSDTADVTVLPDYVVQPPGQGITTTADRHHVDPATGGNWQGLIDPRVPTGKGSPRRGIGFWHKVGTVDPHQDGQFQVTINLNQEASFNLSIYTHSVDHGHYSSMPLQFHEQFGRDLTFVVAGLGETQTFRITNNAPGAWITFPVRGNATTPVTVTVTSSGPNATNVEAAISALAFDPFEDRRTRLSYDPGTGDLLQVTDPLGHETDLAWNPDGTLKTVTTYAGGVARTTQYFYEDARKNLTRIVDALNGETRMTYDLNGNVLTVQDPNLHTSSFQYDFRNRVTLVTDPLNHTTGLEYDPNGNPWRITDAEGRTTELIYTRTNRLQIIRVPLGDPLQQETRLDYDPSGNPVLVTDPRNNQTQLVYDDAERLVQVIQPDSESLKYAFDALDRLVGATAPNGNQADPSLVNVLGAGNLLRNPGAEEDDPYAPALARYWTPAGGIRDGVTKHSGQYSFRLSATGSPNHWAQGNLELPAGVPLYFRQWGLSGTPGSGRQAQYRVAFPAASGTTQELQTGAPYPVYTAAWSQLAPKTLEVPGDAQYTPTNRASVQFGYVIGGSNEDLWLDDLEIYALGTSFQRDREGRLGQVQSPDGARMRLERDRFGRVVRWVDPEGRETRVTYDAMDRVVLVVDPEGNSTALEFDEVGNLISVTDSRGNQTGYEFDKLDRLITITYEGTATDPPTTEKFTYYPAGNLKTYKDNLTPDPNVLAEFFHDAADRLERIQYKSDMTDVVFTHDKVGNVLTRKERNGDLVAYRYDSLYRLKGTNRAPGAGSSQPGWGHSYDLDPNGNRTALRRDDYGARYGAIDYQPVPPVDQEARYSLPGAGNTVWSVPAGGYDAMDRLERFYLDGDPNQEVYQEYDAESRRKLIRYPFPVGNRIETNATFDIAGRVTRLLTTQGPNTILDLLYGYDRASNRTSQVTQTDTFDYGLDEASRLVEEAINRMVTRRPQAFLAGEADGCEVDPDVPAVRMAAIPEAFAGPELNVDRWRPAYAAGTFLGMEVRQDGALEFTFPKGYSNLLFPCALSQYHPPFVDRYGLGPDEVWAGVEHRTLLQGDFVVRVDFEEFQGHGGDWARLGLRIHDLPLERDSPNVLFVAREWQPTLGQGYRAIVKSGGTEVVNLAAPTTDGSGKLRLRRIGTTVFLEYWLSGAWATLGTWPTFTTADLHVSLYCSNKGSVSAGRFRDFGRYLPPGDPETPAPPYPTAATYTSAVYDAGRTPASWGRISWTEALPAGEAFDLEFQVAVSNDPEADWDTLFVGPDGTANTRFTDPAGQALHGSLAGRYLRYRAYLTGDGTATPEFSRVDVTFAGAIDSQLRTYDFDGAGNMVRKSVETWNGTSTDVVTEVRDDDSWPAEDRLNELNQIKRNDVTTNNVTVTWRFRWDANGNLTKKFVGDEGDPDEVWEYFWNEDNRLVRVTRKVAGQTVVDVAYEYDAQGRLLTRTEWLDGVAQNPLMLEWDGWDIVRETAPDGLETVYFAPRGDLLSFRIGDSTYMVHTDALRSLRLISNEYGETVASYSFSGWGESLQSNQLPTGLSRGFVGALACRTDACTGLILMQDRWYCPPEARFLSRDSVRSSNRYGYCHNDPTSFIDPTGIDPVPPNWGLPPDWHHETRGGVPTYWNNDPADAPYWPRVVRAKEPTPPPPMRRPPEGQDRPVIFHYTEPQAPIEPTSPSIPPLPVITPPNPAPSPTPSPGFTWRTPILWGLRAIEYLTCVAVMIPATLLDDLVVVPLTEGTAILLEGRSAWKIIPTVIRTTGRGYVVIMNVVQLPGILIVCYKLQGQFDNDCGKPGSPPIFFGPFIVPSYEPEPG